MKYLNALFISLTLLLFTPHFADAKPKRAPAAKVKKAKAIKKAKKGGGHKLAKKKVKKKAPAFKRRKWKSKKS